MLFPLQQVDTNLQLIEEIPNAFFNNIVDADVFGYELFPAWFQEYYGNRQDGLYQKANNLFQIIKNSGRELEIVNGYWESLQINQHCLSVDTLLFYCEDISIELFTAAKKYFHHLYKTLDYDWFTDYSNTDIIKYIIEFKKSNRVFLCPICGNETITSNRFEARAALDHWFCKAKYPFSSVSWDNLFPLGEGCNRPPIKGENEIVWSENERVNRQIFFYPFNWLGNMQIEFECIEEPSIDNPTSGSWRFNFIGIDETHQILINKWDAFFRVNDRWINETLDVFIETWTQTFAEYLVLEINIEEFELKYNEKLLSFRNSKNKFNIYPNHRVEWFFLNFLINEATPELYNGYKTMVKKHIENN
ncbi:hypothetical protein NAT51_16010 [Flavobacterium amniphilum]|uniref:hypothetical protein n=1 Tax=Flavobacterium amniphilum TaxID=1834035 RepID=UPI00202A2DBB|nr:hypothetical protein [Flavobacterium amniphilum]MCL9807040.1 hypothetical protein [Flavobacterium amniphilum]